MIVPMTASNKADFNTANEPFEVIGRLIPKYEGGSWSSAEELFAYPHEKTYEPCDARPEDYIGRPDRAVFFFTGPTDSVGDAGCEGQIVLSKNWNGYALIEDLSVRKASRRSGVGSALFEKAVDWAKSAGLPGLAAETQDNNLAACRFYAKHGMVIGSVDVMVYDNFPLVADEKAVYWYMKFT